MNEWLILVASAIVIVAAGIRLSHDGDAIAERTGLGGAWIGAILVAGATSLPELTTNTFSVLQGTPNLAAGDLFGSNMVNMLILAIADLSTRSGGLLARVAYNQLMVGMVAIGLMAVAGIGMLGGAVTIGWLGWASIAIVAGYVLGMRLLHDNRPAPLFDTAESAHTSGPSLTRAGVGFGLATLAILAAAPFLAGSAAGIADRLGVSTGFVGLALLAVITSMPEAVVSAESVRRGSYDLAVGNLLGSNAFNIFILGLLDIVDGPTSLLDSISPSMLIGAMVGIALTSLALLEILNRVKSRRELAPIPLLMIAVYLAGVVLVFQAGH
jgi:cation:H+ antiporter